MTYGWDHHTNAWVDESHSDGGTCGAVHGAVRCLALFADELGDDQVIQVYALTDPRPKSHIRTRRASSDLIHCCLGCTQITHSQRQTQRLRRNLSQADCLGHAVQAVPYLFPELLAIVSQTAEFSAEVRRQALSILHSMVGMLATMAGTHDAEIKVPCPAAGRSRNVCESSTRTVVDVLFSYVHL